MPVTFNFVYTVTCDTCGLALYRSDLSLLTSHPPRAQIPNAPDAGAAAIANRWLVTPFSVLCPSCRT